MLNLVPRALKIRLRNLVSPMRLATSKSRVLPDFIILGAQKAGTSSLFQFISEHPQVSPSSKKEIHYFDGGIDTSTDLYQKGEYWYRAHFTKKSELGTGHITGEASPAYLFNPIVPERIYKTIPGAKLIAILRNPTERAISQYFHERKLDCENLSIDAALQQEESRLQLSYESREYNDFDFIHHSYQSRGLYKQQLDRYLQYFPLNQILVLSSEDFFTDPQGTLKQTFEFLDIDKDYLVNDLKPRNVSHNRTKVDARIYSQLDEFYRLPNQALFNLIGREFPW